MPDRGLPYLVLVSTLFQLILYIVRKYKKDRLNYMRQLQATLVENVVNILTFVISTVITVTYFLWILYHVWSVSTNRKKASDNLTADALQAELILLLVLMFCLTSLPFCTRPALR